MAHGFAVWGGPVATVIASIAVTTVSVIFNSRQAEVAKAQKNIAASQRDIAHEKLKADLFDRRFKIYFALREACLHCMRNAYMSRWGEVHALMHEVDGAVFLFSETNYNWLIEVRDEILLYASDCEVLQLTPTKDEEEEDSYRAHQAVLRKKLRIINQKFYEMPKRLKAEMGASEMLKPESNTV